MMKRLILLIFFAGILLYNSLAKKNVWHPIEKVSVIFDTDMGPDYDDVGALAALNALADNGEVEILACGSSNQYEKSVPLIDIINTYYGRPNIPIGSVKGRAGAFGPWHKGRKWTEELPLHYQHTIYTTSEAPDAVSVYRKVLSNQPDSSVTIVTVGFLTNLNNLLKSAPDQISPLTGMELVQKKVKQLVSMAGDFKEGKDACNILLDVQSGKYVFENWPTKIIISGGEIGRSIRTGDRLVKTKTKNNPVKDAYEIAFIEDRLDTVSNYKYRKGGRSSYDQTAVLVAVRGVRNYFDMESGTMVVKDRAVIDWIPDENGNHYRLIDKMPKRDLAVIIEDLMIQKPAKLKYSGDPPANRKPMLLQKGKHPD
ncbi:nucleoside hydrolase [Maribellus comscasis]|nr:nucleoside hydrolase [Maribellus comscasis]